MISRLVEPARVLPVVAEAEVVVLGGGPAGLCAAVAAGRLGCAVLLVERYGCLGGLATGGLVIELESYGPRGQIHMSGLAVEIGQRLTARGVAATPPWYEHEAPTYDPEALKMVAIELAAEANVRLFLHAWGVSALVEDRRITALIIESKSGRQVIRGQIFVDCSGDADLAAWTGAPYHVDDSPWGLGLNMRIAAVDYARFRQFCQEQPARWAELRQDIHHKGYWVPNAGWRNNSAWFNTTFPGNALDVADLTRAEVELRKRLWQAHDFFRQYVPGFEQAEVVDTASQIGTRESRRVEGEYLLTEADLTRTTCPDAIGIGVNWTGPHATERFAIPYGCLIPQGVDNLLVAGRCISADHQAHQNTRVINNCFVTGQGAGVAASVALGSHRSPRLIERAQLQSILRTQGVHL